MLVKTSEVKKRLFPNYKSAAPPDEELIQALVNRTSKRSRLSKLSKHHLPSFKRRLKSKFDEINSEYSMSYIDYENEEEALEDEAMEFEFILER